MSKADPFALHDADSIACRLRLPRIFRDQVGHVDLNDTPAADGRGQAMESGRGAGGGTLRVI